MKLKSKIIGGVATAGALMAAPAYAAIDTTAVVASFTDAAAAVVVVGGAALAAVGVAAGIKYVRRAF